MGETTKAPSPRMPEPGPAAAPFWTFSLAVYGRPGVPDACLAAQDRFGADVNLLLFAAWLGRRAILLDPARLQAARGVSAAWHDAVTTPLRTARRALKDRDGAAAQALRQRVKAAELEAERLEQMALQALAADWAPGGGSAAENLRAVLPAPGAAVLLDPIAQAALAVPHE